MPHDAPYLYVDDDAFSRDAMRWIIEKHMKQPVIILEDSTDFMARLRNLNPFPRMILLDIHMQPHSGFELLAMIKADVQFSRTPVIALTASVMNEEVSRLHSTGFDGAIAKPFSINTLPDLLLRIESGEVIWWITGG